MFEIKFPTKRIFQLFPILKINGMALFCKLIYRTMIVVWQKCKKFLANLMAKFPENFLRISSKVSSI